jgi:hypothetical protein
MLLLGVVGWVRGSVLDDGVVVSVETLEAVPGNDLVVAVSETVQTPLLVGRAHAGILNDRS